MSPAGGSRRGQVPALGEEVLTPPMLRDGAAERQNAALIGAASVHGLKPMERLVLLAYVDAQAHHGHTGV